MIQGRVKPGTHMNEKTAVMETPDPSLRCHSVILVLLPEMRYDDALRGFVDEVVDLGIKPVLVITKTEQFPTDEGKQKCMKEYEEITGVPIDRIFMLDNYREEENSRTSEKDAIYARILLKAFSDAFKLSRAL